LIIIFRNRSAADPPTRHPTTRAGRPRSSSALVQGEAQTINDSTARMRGIAQQSGWPSTKKPFLVRERASSSGGRTQNRTGDTRIFSPLLYRLSYPASLKKGGIKCSCLALVNRFFTFFRIHCIFIKYHLFRAKFKQVFAFNVIADLIHPIVLRTAAS
jgi:hypothetical protein